MFSSLYRIYLLVEVFGRKNFWICLNPRFSMPPQSRAWSVARPSFRESGPAVAYDVYPGTKHNGAIVSSLYLFEKMASKINRSNMFWHWNVQVLFKNHFFFITEVRVKSPKWTSIEHVRQLRVKSLLGALGAICNISSGDGEDLFAEELFVD